MYKIKEGTIDDALNIWQIIEQAWMESGIGNFEKQELLRDLQAMYSKEKVTAEIVSKSQCYLIIYEQSDAVAFASYSFTDQYIPDFRIHKIYSLKSTQGKGYIKILIKKIEHTAIAKQGGNLFIHISRQNRKKEYLEALGFALCVNEENLEQSAKTNEYVMFKKVD